jgi:NADH-quinone oxidoreductase subunit H
MQFLFDFLGQFTGGPANAFIILTALLKIALILGGVLQVVPFIILFERKIISWVQDRPGPNRAGPWGVLHGILDGAKLFFKETITPKGVDKALYLAAPALVVIPAFVALCLVPVGPIIQGPHLDAMVKFLGLDPQMVGSTGQINQIAMAITNPNVGILYVLAITSVGVYGVTLAGWASNNKWSLLGGIRASAQMISYEITLSLAIICAILLSGSLNLYEIIDSQYGGFWNWHIVGAPVAFALFVVAMFAETNRVPFDLAEAEPELTGGFHTEYSSMRFALFFLAEYTNMIIVSAMCSTLFLGGYLGLVQLDWEALAVWASGLLGTDTVGLYPLVIIAGYALGPALIFPAKIAFFMFLFIFARATLPRLRYDQLMNLGWKQLLPIGLVNFVIIAIGVGFDLAYRAGLPGGFEENPHVLVTTKVILGAITLAGLIAYDRLVLTRNRQAQLKRDYPGLGARRDYNTTPFLAS